MPNNGLYSNPDGVRTAQAAAASGISENNNGWSIFSHLTQSFGGWGATNGERIGLFSLVGQESMSIGGIGSAPNGLYHREGMDFAINPLPDGGLNLFGAWEVVFDPSSGIVANPAIFGASLPAISGLSYMAWFLEGDWQPTFNGVFSEEGTGSNMIILSVNQLTMLEQPTFEGITQKLPGNFNDVISVSLADRYSLFSSARAAISFFAEWQWMLNEGVGSIATFGGSRLEGFGTALNAFSNSGFYNVESNVFIAGVDFSF